MWRCLLQGCLFMNFAIPVEPKSRCLREFAAMSPGEGHARISLPAQSPLRAVPTLRTKREEPLAMVSGRD